MTLEVNPVTEAANNLKSRAPREFHEFVMAMQGYCDQLARQVVLADTQSVMYMQGSARNAAKLTSWFFGVDTGEFEEKKKNGPDKRRGG